MRLAIIFETKDGRLPIEYRRMILSVLKKSFESVSKEVYDLFYKDKNTILKPFTFSVYLPKPKFGKEIIELDSNEFTVNFSTSDNKAGVAFYNGLLGNKKRGFEYKNNDKIYNLQLKNVYLNTKEKKKFEEEVVFKTLSPFAVRDHDRNSNNDVYLKPDDNNFSKLLFENTKLKVKAMLGYTINTSDISFMPVKLKKIPVKHYNRFVEAQYGIIKISGNPDIIKMIYNIGLGSNNGYGFGMLEVLG